MRNTFKGYYVIPGLAYGLWVDDSFGNLTPVWPESLVQMVNFVTEFLFENQSENQ